MWIALTCLWERWCPNLANLEMLDDKMQAGYEALEEGKPGEACRLWLAAWRAVLELMARSGKNTIDSFDDLFGGTQRVFNWIQDLEMALHNAGLEEPDFFRERIALCETVLARFAGDDLFAGDFKTAPAQSHYELGNRDMADRLFRKWLDEKPEWSGGWVGWSDCHFLFAKKGDKNPARAEEILKEGLAVPDVDDRSFLQERLKTLYEETGRGKEAAALMREIRKKPIPEHVVSVKCKPNALQVKQTLTFGEKGLPLDRLPGLLQSLHAGTPAPIEAARHAPVGRNNPCPCGSGRKYKKCCGRQR